jgi:hypothetical protein
MLAIDGGAGWRWGTMSPSRPIETAQADSRPYRCSSSRLQSWHPVYCANQLDPKAQVGIVFAENGRLPRTYHGVHSMS